MDRRGFIKWGTALPVAATVSTLPGISTHAFAQQQDFAPQAGKWRTFDVTTRVEIVEPKGVTRVWLPVPMVNNGYQQSLDSRWSAPGGQARVEERDGAKILFVEFPAATPTPRVELTSRVQTQDRSVDWSQKTGAKEDAATLRKWTQPSDLLPTDGIVRDTAREAIKGARTDVDKAKALYGWIVENTYRETTVRGCGVGDIKAMLESGNLGGKCADLNALFVGMARSVGIPARDIYGVRVAPSAFGYKALSATSTNITRAQHCRAEVYLAGYGWVAMDPADVAKVMREETTTWIRNAADPLVAPVNRKLFGGWEGNWMAFNTAHDVSLPQARGPKVGFFMYPIAETDAARLDSLDPDHFKYVIDAREVTTG